MQYPVAHLRKFFVVRYDDEALIELFPELEEQIVQGRTAQGRRLQVRRLAPGEAPTGVNVLFVGGDSAQRVLQSAKTLTERSVLTITGVERGIDHGSVINFVPVDGRVRFEVNVGAAEKSGLRLSSRLLMVATRVKAN